MREPLHLSRHQLSPALRRSKARRREETNRIKQAMGSKVRQDRAMELPQLAQVQRTGQEEALGSQTLAQMVLATTWPETFGDLLVHVGREALLLAVDMACSQTWCHPQAFGVVAARRLLIWGQAARVGQTQIGTHRSNPSEATLEAHQDSHQEAHRARGKEVARGGRGSSNGVIQHTSSSGVRGQGQEQQQRRGPTCMEEASAGWVVTGIRSRPMATLGDEM